MIACLPPTCTGALLIVAAGRPLLGVAAFVSVFVAVLVWLLVMPRRLYNDSETRPPWWRDVRFWAVLVTLAQIAIYLRWG